jgi:outer membrane protein
MKQNTWLVNGILAVAVIVLYVLHFSAPSKQTSPVTEKGASTKVAYFEIDSIQNNYEFFKEVKAALLLKDQENAKQLNNLKNDYVSKYQDLQKNGALLSQAEVANRQQDLMKAEKNYQSKEQQLTQELQEESFKRLQEVKKNIEVYLNEYNKGKQFAYILSSNPDLMYYKDTAYDITADIVKGLNAAYKPKK